MTAASTTTLPPSDSSLREQLDDAAKHIGQQRERIKALEAAFSRPVSDAEFSAAYLDMFSLAHDDENTDEQPELSQNQRGAIICQILLRRRLAALSGGSR